MIAALRFLRFGMIIAVTGLLLSACYESSTPLDTPERGAIEPKLIGTWLCRNPEGSKTATLSVQALDSTQYHLEWRDGRRIHRFAAHSSDVGGAVLYNVRDLGSDPRPRTWVLMRAALPTPATLIISVIDEKELKPFDERAAHREIRRRAKDDTLYTPVATCERQ